MQYRRCKCGKAERWDSGWAVRECEGCGECQTTYAQRAEDHKPLQPHDYEPYYMGGSGPNPAQICKRCHHIERPAKEPTESVS